MRTSVYIGSEEDRTINMNYIIYGLGVGATIKKRNTYLSNIVITSFQTMVLDAKFFESIPWAVTICDDSGMLENVNSKSFISLKSLKSDFKILLSEVDNIDDIQEYFSLFTILDPTRYIFPYSEYAKTSNKPVSELTSLVLRREKKNIVRSMFKLDVTLQVKMSPVEKFLLRRIFQSNSQALMHVFDDEATIKQYSDQYRSIFNQLLKCTSHPYLILYRDEEPVSESDNESLLYLFNSSSKISLLGKLLKELKKEHKVLVLTAYSETLDIIEEYLNFYNLDFQRIDGKTTVVNDKPVYIASTTSSYCNASLLFDTVIIYDPNWSTEKYLKLVERYYSMKNKDTLSLIKFTCKDSIEELILQVVSKQNAIDSTFLAKVNELEPIFRQIAKKVFSESINANEPLALKDAKQVLENTKSFSLEESSIRSLLQFLTHPSGPVPTQCEGGDICIINNLESNTPTPTIESSVNPSNLHFWSKILQLSDDSPTSDSTNNNVDNIIMLGTEDVMENWDSESDDDWQEDNDSNSKKDIVENMIAKLNIDGHISELERLKKSLPSINDPAARSATKLDIRKLEHHLQEARVKLKILERQLRNEKIDFTPSRVIVLGFSKGQRHAFISLLMRFGLGVTANGKWQFFASKAASNKLLKQKSLKELSEFGTFFLEHLSEQVEPRYSHYSDGVPTDSIDSAKLLQRLGSMFVLHNMVIRFENFPQQTQEDLNVIESELKQDSSWDEISEWNKCCDLIIMQGCIKHGYCRWDDILSDQSFSFASTNSILKQLHNTKQAIHRFLTSRITYLINCLSHEYSKKKLN